MSLYTVYATLDDLAAYLGVAKNTLPDNSTRLLTRASELVKQSTLDNIISTIADHMEAAKLATCAQVEYWNLMGEEVSMTDSLNDFKIGDVAMSFGNSKLGGNTLCNRSKAYLNEQALLYRGIRQKSIIESGYSV